MPLIQETLIHKRALVYQSLSLNPTIQWVVIVVQSLSRVRLFVTPWTVAHQTSLFFTISWSLLKLMSIESMMLSNHLFLCCPLLLPSIFPSIRVFSVSWLFASGGQSIGASASASVFPMSWLFASGGQSTGASASGLALSMDIQG